MTDQSIYLVRHGETAFNADGRLRGLADPDLNAAGLGQAKSLASAFASARTSIMVSSPLLRAVHRRRSSPKAARPSTRSTCGSMIATTDAGPVNPRLTSSRNGAPSTRHREEQPTSSILSRARPALDAWAEGWRKPAITP